MRDDLDDAHAGIGTVVAARDGFELQGVIALDTAWRIAQAVENDLIDTAVVICDVIPDRGQSSIMRSITFRSGMPGA